METSTSIQYGAGTRWGSLMDISEMKTEEELKLPKEAAGGQPGETEFSRT
jgi:hypothetical protein